MPSPHPAPGSSVLTFLKRACVAPRSAMGDDVDAMPRVISQRQLRNDNARVIEAVLAGETFLVTRNGVPVAELGPVRQARKRQVRKAELLALVRGSERIDGRVLRADLDAVVDARW